MSTDTRTVRRIGAAILLPLGPLAVAILRGILPYGTNDDSRAMIAHTATGIGRQDAVLWLVLIGVLALIPSALAAARLAQRRAPLLSLVSVVLLVPAFAAMALGVSAVDPVLRVLAGGTVDPATGAQLLDAVVSLAPVTVASVLFIAGHLIGMIVLGAALWRARVVPVWAALAVLVSQPLHLVFAVIVPNPLLDACAWGLAALGLAVAAIQVLRTSNDGWDLAPATASSIKE